MVEGADCLVEEKKQEGKEGKDQHPKGPNDPKGPGTWPMLHPDSTFVERTYILNNIAIENNPDQ